MVGSGRSRVEMSLLGSGWPQGHGSSGKRVLAGCSWPSMREKNLAPLCRSKKEMGRGGIVVWVEFMSRK